MPRVWIGRQWRSEWKPSNWWNGSATDVASAPPYRAGSVIGAELSSQPCEGKACVPPRCKECQYRPDGKPGSQIDWLRFSKIYTQRSFYCKRYKDRSASHMGRKKLECSSLYLFLWQVKYSAARATCARDISTLDNTTRKRKYIPSASCCWSCLAGACKGRPENFSTFPSWMRSSPTRGVEWNF